MARSLRPSARTAHRVLSAKRHSETSYDVFGFAGVYFDGHFVESVPGLATKAPSRSVPSTTTSRPVRNRSGTLPRRSEEHTSELQSRELISYAVFCLKKKKQ